MRIMLSWLGGIAAIVAFVLFVNFVERWLGIPKEWELWAVGAAVCIYALYWKDRTDLWKNRTDDKIASLERQMRRMQERVGRAPRPRPGSLTLRPRMRLPMMLVIGLTKLTRDHRLR
jgi:hypothetical protein